MKMFSKSRLGVWALILFFSAQVVFAQDLGDKKATAPGEAPGANTDKLVVKSEVAPVAVQPKKTAANPGVPGINPFVAEIAVGASLLITYGPQILALALSVATVASVINKLIKKKDGSAALSDSIGSKLKNMLQLLLGPLSISTGTAKEGVEGVSAELLRTAKFITNNISNPVDKVNGQLDRAITMSKDIEKLSRRGKDVAERMEKMSIEANRELDNIVAGGEIQIFRDGSKKVASRLEQEARTTGIAFNKSISNSMMSVSALQEVKNYLSEEVQKSGKTSSEVSLFDLGVSSSEVSKKLIEARKYMVKSRNSLKDAETETGGVHTDILAILGGIKGDLEKFAKDQGIADELLERTIKEETAKKSSSSLGKLVRQNQAKSEYATNGLSEEISFMVDDLREMNAKANKSLRLLQEGNNKTPKLLTENFTQKPDSASPADKAFGNKLSAYQELLKVMTKDPGNRRAIQEAQAAYQLAEMAYQENLAK